MGLANSIRLDGMEKNDDKSKQEFFEGFKTLPQDVQNKINNLMLQDAIAFLASQPLHTLAGHTNNVSSVAVAGDKVVTGSDDSTAKIWDINTGQLLHTLAGHTEDVVSVAVAGDKVVTGSRDNTAKIWDINTGQLLHTLAGHTLVAVANDKVVTGSDYDTARIWDINTGQLLHTFTGDTGEVSSVAVANDKVVTGSSDGTAKIWDINMGQLLHTLAGHTGEVNSVAVAGDKVVTGSEDKTAKIWTLKPFAGTPQDNALVWIIYNVTLPQADFIKRAYEATIQGQNLIIAMPTKLGTITATDSQAQQDGNVYFSFPEHVRAFLRNSLNIRKPTSWIDWGKSLIGW